MHVKKKVVTDQKSCKGGNVLKMMSFSKNFSIPATSKIYSREEKERRNSVFTMISNLRKKDGDRANLQKIFFPRTKSLNVPVCAREKYFS